MMTVSIRPDGRWGGSVTSRPLPEDDSIGELSPLHRCMLADIWLGRAASERRVAREHVPRGCARRSYGSAGAGGSARAALRRDRSRAYRLGAARFARARAPARGRGLAPRDGRGQPADVARDPSLVWLRREPRQARRAACRVRVECTNPRVPRSHPAGLRASRDGDQGDADLARWRSADALIPNDSRDAQAERSAKRPIGAAGRAEHGRARFDAMPVGEREPEPG